jgi:hypothetical protein
VRWKWVGKILILLVFFFLRSNTLFMSFEDTFIHYDSILPIVPKNVPTLLSVARSEFHKTQNYSGTFMKEVTDLFSFIAKELYSTTFSWSDYNSLQWLKFVSSRASSEEGGACMFSCENGGQYSSSNNFKKLFVGLPTGIHAYAIEAPEPPKSLVTLQAALIKYGKYSLDLVG